MAAAIIGGAVSAAGSIGSSLISSSAATGAAQTQANAANAGVGVQQGIFNRIQGNIQPWLQGGAQAANALLGLLGLSPGPGTQVGARQGGGQYTIQQISTTGGPGGTFQTFDPNGNPVPGTFDANALGIQQAGVDQMNSALPKPALATGGAADPNAILNSPLGARFQPTMAQLAQTPGYQFALEQGLLGTQNSYAAQGLATSGSALKGAANYAEGLASTTYQQQFNNYITGNSLLYNMLSGISGLGQNAAVASGNQGVQVGANIASSLAGAGNALAAGQVGSANALAGGLGGVGQLGLILPYLQNSGGLNVNALNPMTNAVNSGSNNPFGGQ